MRPESVAGCHRIKWPDVAGTGGRMRPEYAIILKDNKPAYVIVSFKEGLNLPFNTLNKKKSQYTLHEAMKIVLLEKESKKMHAAELSEEIFKRGLYYKKDGGKARYNQIRARANNYPDLFITLEKNYIKLVEE
jgi:antitoxin Phd